MPRVENSDSMPPPVALFGQVVVDRAGVDRAGRRVVEKHTASGPSRVGRDRRLREVERSGVQRDPAPVVARLVVRDGAERDVHRAVERRDGSTDPPGGRRVVAQDDLLHRQAAVRFDGAAGRRALVPDQCALDEGQRGLEGEDPAAFREDESLRGFRRRALAADDLQLQQLRGVAGADNLKNAVEAVPVDLRATLADVLDRHRVGHVQVAALVLVVADAALVGARELVIAAAQSDDVGAGIRVGGAYRLPQRAIVLGAAVRRRVCVLGDPELLRAGAGRGDQARKRGDDRCRKRPASPPIHSVHASTSLIGSHGDPISNARREGSNFAAMAVLRYERGGKTETRLTSQSTSRDRR